MDIEIARAHDSRYFARQLSSCSSSAADRYIEFAAESTVVRVDGIAVVRFVKNGAHELKLEFLNDTTVNARERALRAVVAMLEALLPAARECHRVVIEPSPAPALTEQLLREGLILRETHGALIIPVDLIWQHAEFWLEGCGSSVYPYRHALSNGRGHPLRPPKPTHRVYSRFIPWLEATFSWRALQVERDVELLHRWMNNPRVAHFWKEDGEIAHQRRYLTELQADPHTTTLIGSLDDEPFVYVEAYWAKEDRIAPFYDAADYDRGWHVLVGEEDYLGSSYFAAWFPSLAHYLFLDDCRTQRLVCEPRADNARLIANLDRNGYAQLKHFNFPHKRALLAMLTRERFFGEMLLAPRWASAPEQASRRVSTLIS